MKLSKFLFGFVGLIFLTVLGATAFLERIPPAPEALADADGGGGVETKDFGMGFQLGIVKQEYELDSLKREKAFIAEELNTYKEKALIYEKQIDELTGVYAEKISQLSATSKESYNFF